MNRRTLIGAVAAGAACRRHSAAPRISARSSGVAGVAKRGVSGVRNPPAVISRMWIAPRELPGDWSEENNPAGLLEDIQRFGAPQTFCMQSVLLE